MIGDKSVIEAINESMAQISAGITAVTTLLQKILTELEKKPK